MNTTQSDKKNTVKARIYQFEAYHVLPDSPQMQRDFLFMLASLESHCDTPMAKEVVRIARANNILPMSVIGFQYFEGRGVGGLVTLPDEQRPRAMLLGSRAFMAENGLQTPDILEVTARKWESESGCVIAIGGWDGWVRGVLNFRKS